MTKGLIDLSFWDNPNVVNYTCKILKLIFELAIKLKNFSIRNEIEKLLDFIYLRHFKQYFHFLEEKNNIKESDKSIKLSVLELLSRNFNELIGNNNFLPIIFFINDIYKIRFNIINEIFDSINKYFTLKSPSYNYLKNSFIITYDITFNSILEHLSKNPNNLNNNNKLTNFEELAEYWEKKLKLVKEGNLKELIKNFSEEYNLVQLKKNDKENILNEQNKIKYKEIAKEVAILIRYSNYVNIENLFEIMAESNPFSNMILQEYSSTYNFKGYSIVKAMNLFMSTFRLMGESYNIYNFICAFGNKFYKDNKEIFENNKSNKEKESIYFKSEEEVISFAYSIMILNTDLHNPNVLNKMSVEDFIKNNKSSGLFSDMPDEYFKEIYQEIHDTELKKANYRNDNYTKDAETFLNLNSLEYFPSLYKELNYFYTCSIFDIFKPNTTFTLTKENYPYLNLFNKIYINKNDDNNIWINYSYMNLFDELLPSIISLPDSFFENNIEIILNLFYKICEISLKLNKKEIINKIIIFLNDLLNKGSKNKNIFNLYFNIVLKYIQDFHNHLEIFHSSILELLNLNLKEEDYPLHKEYIKDIDNLINKSFEVITSKRKNKVEGVGFINLLFFGDNKDKKELSLDEFKLEIYKKINFESTKNKITNNLVIQRSNSTKVLKSNLNKLKKNYYDNNTTEEERINSSSENLNLILDKNYSLDKDLKINDENKIKNKKEINKEINFDLNINFKKEENYNRIFDVKLILNKIKSQEEEFIFFVTYATNKILENKVQNSFFTSLIFLKEILMNVQEKQFGKIWPNIFNIFKTKMNFKNLEEDNIFEVLFSNYYLTEIIKDYFNIILNEDYNQILESYEDINSLEFLLTILEYNDLLIKSAISSKKSISIQNLEILVLLLYKLFYQLSNNITNLNNNYLLESPKGTILINQMNTAINILNNILLTIKNGDILSQESCSRISNIIKLIYDNNIPKLFFQLQYDIRNISDLISILAKIISDNIAILTNYIKTEKIEDEEKLTKIKQKMEVFHDNFIFLGQFVLKCSLIEDENLQQIFFSKISFFTSITILPEHIQKVIFILQEWQPFFSQLSIKYKNYWKDVINTFYLLFFNNTEFQKNTTYIEKLWTLLIKKYMISFNEEKKSSNNLITKEERENIKKIYNMVKNIVNKITNSQKINWFESTKNMIKLYFPEVLVDSN